MIVVPRKRAPREDYVMTKGEGNLAFCVGKIVFLIEFRDKYLVDNDLYIIKQDWLRKLDAVSLAEWDDLKWNDIETKRIIYICQLWHLEDGTDERVTFGKVGNRIERRFALENHPVSYWAGDYSIALSEKIPSLKKNDVRVIGDIFHVVPDKPISPYRRHLSKSVALLDLRNDQTPFFHVLKNHGLIEDAAFFIKEFISSSENVKAYLVTQAIVERAYQNGFGAIAWNSARSFTDAIAAAEWCVVVFDDSYLRLDRDPEPEPFVDKL